MYTIDTKYLQKVTDGQIYDGDKPLKMPKDPSKSPVKYSRIKRFNSMFYIGITPGDSSDPYLRINPDMYGFITHDGVELFEMNGTEFQEYSFGCEALLREATELKVDSSNSPNTREKQAYERAKEAYFSFYCEPIASAVAREPELIKHVPLGLFEEYPGLEAQILGKLQEEAKRRASASSTAALAETIKQIRDDVAYIKEQLSLVDKLVQAVNIAPESGAEE